MSWHLVLEVGGMEGEDVFYSLSVITYMLNCYSIVYEIAMAYIFPKRVCCSIETTNRNC